MPDRHNFGGVYRIPMVFGKCFLDAVVIFFPREALWRTASIGPRDGGRVCRLAFRRRGAGPHGIAALDRPRRPSALTGSRSAISATSPRDDLGVRVREDFECTPAETESSARRPASLERRAAQPARRPRHLRGRLGSLRSPPRGATRSSGPRPRLARGKPGDRVREALARAIMDAP
jgi:hypothetical protein